MGNRIYDYRIMIYSQQICPCNKCQERSAECHGKCEKYKEYRQKLDSIKAECSKAKQKEVNLKSYVNETHLKNTRQKDHEK